MLGADLDKTGVQPVWIEVQNRTLAALVAAASGNRPGLLLAARSRVVACTRRSRGDANARIDDHFDRLAIQEPDPPGSDARGHALHQPRAPARSSSTSICSGRRTLIPFSLFLPVPDDAAEPRSGRSFQLSRCRRSPTTRTSPRCARRWSGCHAVRPMRAGTARGDPLNAVFVGELADIGAALVRRNYRRDARRGRHGAAGLRPRARRRAAQAGAGGCAVHLDAPVARAHSLRGPLRLPRAGRTAGRRAFRAPRTRPASSCMRTWTRREIS